MRSTRPAYLIALSVFLILLTTGIAVRADDDDNIEDYDVKDRVARISFVSGDVKITRSGNSEEKARLNTPLVEGDLLTTGNESRLEIQLDARNFVRVGSQSALQITTLRDDGIALSLTQGTASIQLTKFSHDNQYFEVDAPNTTLAAESEGLYRIDVSPDGRVALTARSGGRARIYSQTSGFVLRDGRTAELVGNGPNAGDWEFNTANVADAWDNWVDERDRFLAERVRQDAKHYDDHLWGADDLNAYGTWIYEKEYGWMWRPNADAIAGYDNWAPYRYGNWTYLPPYGWTWVGYEPWGWAPYHYGRWVYYNHYWAWCPRSDFYRDRSWWRPALVAFVSLDFSFGDSYCWYPLHYHQRDPRSRNYHHDRDHGRGRDHDRDHDRDRDRDRHRNPDNSRGVTYVSRRDFGHDRRNLTPANGVIAERVVYAEPLTNLPARPTIAGLDTPSITRSLNRLPRTGAEVRRPGIPMDDQLRASRIFNGRDVRPPMPTPTGGAGAVTAPPTGVVARPGRRERPRDPREDGGRDMNRDLGDADRPVTSGVGGSGRDHREDGGRDANRDNGNSDQQGAGTVSSPVTNRRDHRDDGGRDANQDMDQERRPHNVTPVSVPRNDPPRSDPPRSDPPRNDPPPHNDPPHNDPPPRSDPPPAPRSDPPPPPRNDPPAERHSEAPQRDKPPR